MNNFFNGVYLKYIFKVCTQELTEHKITAKYALVYL